MAIRDGGSIWFTWRRWNCIGFRYLTANPYLLFQETCDALLITTAKQLDGKYYSIAGKTFEYIQMQKPIVAFLFDGAQKDLLVEGGTSLGFAIQTIQKVL